MAGASKAVADSRANLPFVYRQYSAEQLREVLYKMYLIRRFEEGAEECYTRGLIHGTMHLSIGQEASAMGICMPLAEDDQITSTHRGHGHCIAKGAEVKRMFAEFFGKTTGYCKGRGGSMHIADVAKGNLGANGIVGGGIPIAVGAALSVQDDEDRQGRGSFFGDGANNEGAFHEALNMAAIWKLPVIFVCENNGYGMSTSTARSTAVKNIAERAAAYSMPGVIVNGNIFSEVAEASHQAVAASPRRRGADADRIQDLSPSRPFQERPQPLPHQGGDRGLDVEPRSDHACSKASCGIRLHRRQAASRPFAAPWRRKSPTASSSPRRARLRMSATPATMSIRSRRDGRDGA